MPKKASSKDIISTAENRKRSVKRGKKASSSTKSKTKVSVKTKSKIQAVAKKVKAVSRTIKRRIKRSIKKGSNNELVGAPASQILVSVDDVLLTPQERIEDTKYFVAKEEPKASILPRELPTNYGDNKLVLMVRDPWWIFAYWEVQPNLVEEVKTQIPDDKKDDLKFVMRIYDVSYVDFNGKNAHYYFDITLPYGAERWYINVNAPGRSWVAEMGWLSSDGQFYPVVRSNVVYTPLDGPSWITDEEWAIPEELFNKLYGLSVGFGGLGAGLSSAELHKLWNEQVISPVGSGAVSSWGGSEVLMNRQMDKKEGKGRKFWLVVNTELIVYGATEPSAKVYVQGKEVNLRPDGTFSLRFALPDGQQVIPVKGISSDGVDEIVITPVVRKETR